MNRLLDKFGICLSGLCLVHCLITPVIIILFPTLRASLFHNELFHQIFGVMVISSVLMAVYPHCRRHGHKDIVAFALAGVTFIVVALFFGHDYGEVIEHGLTITGSILLIIAHIRNIKVRHGRCESTECGSN